MIAIAGNERFSDLLAPVCADGDVLEIRIVAAQPAGNCNRLIETGMQPAGAGVIREGSEST